MNDKIKLVILCGKAGAGKDTILKEVIRRFPDKFNEIVSCTTRPPREGEVDGVNYHFLTVEQFTEKILNGDMLEATEFREWHYGTMLSSLSREKINIGVFNPAGVACLVENDDLDITLYIVTANDKQRLLRQLLREENPDVHEIIRRFSTDEADFQDLEIDDYVVLHNEIPSDIEVSAKIIEYRAHLDNILK